ncbi:MAG: polysaccharide biosynthesis/export family protein [Pirellulales bacterium]
MATAKPFRRISRRRLSATGTCVVALLAVAITAGSSQWARAQALGPAAPFCIGGVDSTITGGCGEAGWDNMGPLPWQQYAQGEYVGHARTAHVPEYRLRVDDTLDFIYRLTRDPSAQPYRLNVGDELRVESFVDPDINRDLLVQPDGTITLRLLGQVQAANRTVQELRKDIDDRYREFYNEPAISVIPLKVDTRLEDLRDTINGRFGQRGQSLEVRVTPEGTVQLPAVGSVPVQGMTLTEVRVELQQRYGAEFSGLEVIPVLRLRAPRYAFVLGEVQAGGRFELVGPTTVMQALALAGGHRVGANLRQVVVFRRGDDWRLMATMLDLRGAVYGKSPVLRTKSG